MTNFTQPTVNEDEFNYYLPKIKKFLIYDCEFERRPFYVIRNLAILIARNMSANNLKIANEYTAVTGDKMKGNSLRVMLTKFLKENHKIIKAAAQKTHCYKLQSAFGGVKSFIDDISFMFYSE